MKSTRDRILDTAERLFAEKGYDGVSIREITSEAKSNVASINYYFGNKKGLYLAVFKERMIERARKVQASFWKEIELYENPSAETIIRSLARAFLKSPFSERERILHHKLMAREVNRPGEAFKLFHSEVLKPFYDSLISLLEPHMKRGLTKQQKMLFVLSIMAQIINFHLARNMIISLTGKSYNGQFVDVLIENIVQFSLYGIKGRS
ncbi:MAG: DUF1956 domain-containing protein [Nitrospirae bacterium]|nr:MAG: DUF1956 domain-containing protein [Nitrospirota bacterium]